VAQANYRQSDTWKAGLDLAPKLLALAEDLPASEEMGLSYRLKKIMVELPAAAAHDQLRGTDTRQRVALQLMAVIDLVDKVYPALDTADTRAAAEKLADQLLENMAFTPERVPGDAHGHPADPHAHSSHPNPGAEPHAPEPVNVPVMPDTEGTQITLMPPEHHSVSVAVQPDSESSHDVHPDSAE
jgi:hypothetical protein